MKQPNLRTVLDHIIIRPDPPEARVGTLEIPDIAQTAAFTGTVVAVGRGGYGWKRSLLVKPGDRVVIDRYGVERCGMPLQYRGEELLVMRESDIAAVIS